MRNPVASGGDMSPKSEKPFVRSVGRRDFIKLGLAAGSVLIASCSRSQATATDTPIASPTIEIAPLPIEFAAYTELNMSEQSRLLATLPEDRPALPENGLHDMAGLKLSNGLQEETIAFIVYEIDPKEGYTVVLDSTNEKVNYRQSAVMYMEEIDGQGNRSWVKLFGLTVNKVDQQGKIIERQTTWFKPGPADVDSNKKTVSVNTAESVLSYKTTASDGITQMLFTPLFPKNYLAGMPDTSTTPLPVNLPGVTADKMVSIEAAAPESPKLPEDLDKIYKDQIEKFGFKFKVDGSGNILVNFGTGSRFLSGERDKDGYILAFKNTPSGFETVAFIHDLGPLDPTTLADVEIIGKYSKTNGVEVIEKDNRGYLSIMAVSTGIFIEEKANDSRPGKPDIKTVYHLFNTVNPDGKVVTLKVLYRAFNSDGETTSIVINPGDTISQMKARFKKDDLKALNMPTSDKQLRNVTQITLQFLSAEIYNYYSGILENKTIPDGMVCYTISAADL